MSLDLRFILITSNKCGHCIRYRGNGRINNGSLFMSDNYIKEILKNLEKKCCIININILDHNSVYVGDKYYNNIDSISYIFMENGNIYQRFFSKNNNYVQKEFISYSNGLIQKEILKLNNDKNYEWNNFIKVSSPSHILQRIRSFPSYLFTFKKNWETSINDRSDFYYIGYEFNQENKFRFVKPLIDKGLEYIDDEIQIEDDNMLSLFNKKLISISDEYKDNIIVPRKIEPLKKEENKVITSKIKYYDNNSNIYVVKKTKV